MNAIPPNQTYSNSIQISKISAIEVAVHLTATSPCPLLNAPGFVSLAADRPLTTLANTSHVGPVNWRANRLSHFSFFAANDSSLMLSSTWGDGMQVAVRFHARGQIFKISGDYMTPVSDSRTRRRFGHMPSQSAEMLQAVCRSGLGAGHVSVQEASCVFVRFNAYQSRTWLLMQHECTTGAKDETPGQAPSTALEALQP